MNRYMRIFFVLLTITTPKLVADEKKTVCLNMIIKDEKDVIKRCLGTVKPLIDYWVIVDTGSSDGTQEIVRKFMQDIPGELFERPWVNFEHNRNEALALAKGKADYTLIIDADDAFVMDDDFVLPKLEKEGYFIETNYSGTRYSRLQLVDNRFDWKWSGVLHESLGSTQARDFATLKGIKQVITREGARSKDPEKFQKDAKILEAALIKEPNNARYVFYLAQSYKDAQDNELGIQNYKKRVALGGWDQEVFWSLLQIGILQERLKMPLETIAESYYKAYLYRPTRAEPLYYLANLYRNHGDFFSGYIVAREGLSIPLSNDLLFLENWAYDYGMLLEYSICAYWLGKYGEAQMASYLILGKQGIPQNVRECVERNLVWINEKIGNVIKTTPVPN